MTFGVRRLTAAALLVLGVAVTSGCNTVEGFGEDLEALGGAMSSKAGSGGQGQEEDTSPSEGE